MKALTIERKKGKSTTEREIKSLSTRASSPEAMEGFGVRERNSAARRGVGILDHTEGSLEPK